MKAQGQCVTPKGWSERTTAEGYKSTPQLKVALLICPCLEVSHSGGLLSVFKGKPPCFEKLLYLVSDKAVQAANNLGPIFAASSRKWS